MTQNNAVEVNSGVGAVSKAAVLVGAGLLAVSLVTLTVGKLANPTPHYQPPTATTVVGVDAGSFATLATPLPREIAVTATDAGTPAKFDPTERRKAFKAEMEELAKNIGGQYKDNVTAEKIYFAVTNTAKGDAAIVVMKAEKMNETTVLFFVFVNGTWKTFPSDFQ